MTIINPFYDHCIVFYVFYSTLKCPEDKGKRGGGGGGGPELQIFGNSETICSFSFLSWVKYYHNHRLQFDILLWLIDGTRPQLRLRNVGNRIYPI